MYVNQGRGSKLVDCKLNIIYTKDGIKAVLIPKDNEKIYNRNEYTRRTDSSNI